ncbi:TonB-dependent receptor [Nibrella saemangeumensis]|uniref:TonB-dependent receptor n=2 Tax=Nibrella saemangeumensis TaxID=1084526 RepID=A0ABP8NKI8_9BACT
MCYALSYGQQNRLTGRITSADDGQPLPGVSIVVKGSTMGTTTDANGAFSLSAPTDARLVVSMVGYASQEIAVGNRSRIDLVLSPDQRQLDEVVVVGFGTQTRRDLTGSVSSIKPEQISQIPTANFQSALQGLAPGLNIVSASGAAGAPPRVRIRGSGSIYSNGEPLYIIDGVPVDSDNSGLFGQTSRGGAPSNPMANIDPNDIESLEVLKDAAASAIYGARAANGVIIITTKKGRAGKTKFNAGLQLGTSSPTNRLAYADGTTYIQLRDEAIRNAVGSGLIFNGLPGGVATQWQNGGYDQWFNNQVPAVTFNRTIAEQVAAQNINHFDDVFRVGSNRQFTISAQGGTEKTQFFTSVGLYDEQGIIQRNDFRRLNGRVNIDHQATSRLKIGVQLNASYTNNGMFPMGAPSTFAGGFVPGGFFTASTALLPIFPRLNNDGTYFAPAQNLSMLAYRDRSLFFNTTENQRYLTNFYADYELAKGLSWRSEVGNDFIYQQVRYYQNPQLTAGGLQQGLRGINDFRTRSTNNFNSNHYLTFNRTLAKAHALNATLGLQYNYNNTQSSYIQSNNIPSAPSLNTTQVAGLATSQNRLDEFAFLSYFARVNYKFQDRYLLSVSYRADGSSRFGANNRYAFFPSVSGAWVMSEEPFLKGNSTLTFLKLRASWGLSGNSNPGSIEPISYGGFGIGAAFYGDHIGFPYRRVPELANQIRWEQSALTDVAIDFGFLNDRINGTLNYYTRNTTDLILGVTPAPAAGIIGGRNFLNIGALRNSGFEANLAAKILTGKLRWQVDVNAAYNRNGITDLGGLPPTAVAFNPNRVFVGMPLATYFLPQQIGVDPQTGYEIFADLKRNGDGTPLLDANGYPEHDLAKPITVDFLGRIAGTTTNVNWESISAPIRNKPGQPFWTGSVGSTIGYKGLSLNALFTYSLGGWIYDAGARDQAYMLQANRNIRAQFVEDRWQKPGDVATNPGLYFNPVYAGQNSTRFLYNGDFWRLRNLRLGYDLPRALVQKLRVDRLNVFVNGTNLLTFTKFPGWDPEVAGQLAYQDFNFQGQNLGPLQVNSDPPQARTWLIGINIGF